MPLDLHIYHHFPTSPAEASKLEAILALLGKVHKQGEKLMSQISDFAAKVNTDFDAIGKAVDGIAADVAALKAQIQALQDSAGQITPEDQALLDGIQAKADAISSKVTDLDSQTDTPPAP